MTFKEFEEAYNKRLKSKPSFIRKGQALIILLSQHYNEEYKRLSSVHYYDKTDIDCYFADKLIPNTLKHLEKVWINYPN